MSSDGAAPAAAPARPQGHGQALGADGELAREAVEMGSRLAELHERVQAIALGSFRAWALQWLASECAAESGSWEIGPADGGRVNCSVSVGQPMPNASSAAMEVICAGKSRAATRGTLGRILRRMASDPTSGLTSTIAIGRHRASADFTTVESARFGVLAEHVLIAWRLCQQLDLQRRAPSSLGRSAALVDIQGYVHAADRQFFSTVRQSWPHWTGPRIPEPLCTLLAENGTALAVGERQWTWALAERELRYLQTAPLGALSRLTARERAIALAIVAGGTYRECAAHFGISANTLRNTVVRVYRKLSVATKLELAERIRPITQRGQ